MPKNKTLNQQERPVVNSTGLLLSGFITIDGTRCVNSRLIDISDGGGQVETTGQVVELTEFFLMLTTFGNPVFRRCKREWVQGARVGVSFKKTNFGVETFEEACRKEKPVS